MQLAVRFCDLFWSKIVVHVLVLRWGLVVWRRCVRSSWNNTTKWFVLSVGWIKDQCEKYIDTLCSYTYTCLHTYLMQTHTHKVVSSFWNVGFVSFAKWSQHRRWVSTIKVKSKSIHNWQYIRSFLKMTAINTAELLLPTKLYDSPNLCAKYRYVMCILNGAIIWKYCQRVIVNGSDNYLEKYKWILSTFIVKSSKKFR